jgi:YARHG domain-containing protein
VKAADSSRFILPESSSRTLTDADLKGMTVDQLRFARNEIYARKGRFFRDPGLAAHFSQFVWYKPSSWDVVLTEIEQANVSFIQTAERRVSLSSR